MRSRIIVSPAEKRNVTIDRCPPIKSREICTSLKFRNHSAARKYESALPKFRVVLAHAALAA
jgi:hypothetical protein